ncbi:MAG: SDR family oxidoreductase [Nitriliruptorales bacterium]|nr:SDR family oxidoreductase [Nitriliruptorales bacterium]
MGEVAIVTGGASGIGLAISKALVDRGDEVVIADIDGAAAQNAARELGTASVTPTELDVADPDAVAELIQTVHRERGRLGLLFNNAGIGAAAPVDSIGLAHWERTIDVNLRGVLHGCHAALPLMREQGAGHIVNTASLAGLLGGLGAAAPYATTKHAVVGLTLALRVAAAPWGVGVHVVCPGGVDTPILDKTEFPGLPPPDGAEVRSMRSFSEEMGVRRFYPSDRLARDVLRGISRDRPIIVTPMSARVAWRMWRLMPGRMLALSTRFAKREAASS